ncbi:MAG: 30S ribosomal protein S20 [Ruminiclostridium sp.]|nr:30S ribosomal protein S20 [Ruminiclostridium sp.]
MPNIKSAIKRVKTTQKKTEQNKVERSDMRTAIKHSREAITANSDNKLELLNTAIKKVDKAASRKIIHKNTASRRKSQLMKACNASKAAE